MLGRTVFPTSTIFDTHVSADGSPEYKPGGITVDWANTVSAPGSDVTLTDGSLVKSGDKYLRYGQVMTKITSTAIDTVTITGAPTGGTFTVTVTTPNGTVNTAQTTTGVAYNASAATLQTAIQALSNVGTNNATVTGTGYSAAEIDTFTPTTPTAGDTITITNAAGTVLASIVVGASPSATTITTQLKQAWATNPQATAIATASGTATFILTGVTAGVALNLTANISGTGTLPKVVTAATLPFAITFPNALGPVTVAASGASLTGGTSPAATAAQTTPGGNFGWFGPFDPTATDGRATLTRGQCYVMDQTLLQYGGGSKHTTANDQVGGEIEGGLIFIDRVIQSGTNAHSLSAGPTLAEFLAAFPRFRIAQD